MKIMPCPSPRATNNERLFLIKAPLGTSAGALDQALRRGRAHDKRRGAHDEERGNLDELRDGLENLLRQ